MTLYAYAVPNRLARRWMVAQDYRRGPSQLPVNVRDEGEAFVLTAAIPGVNAEDVKVQVLDDVVLIEGEFKADESEFLVRELPQGSFRRELTLTVPLDAQQVEAKVADGVLSVRLPKAESAKPRTIKVAVK